MPKTFKPEGYNSASPYFIISDATRFIALLEAIFDARVTRRYDMPDGTIMHAEVQIDDSIVMLGEASERFPAVPMVMHVYVADVDALYQKALDVGCVSVEPPKERDGDPDRRATFRDFGGNMWSVGTQK
jgi:PhnB protein